MDHRERIVAEAARLLAEGGRDAVSTRAVAAAAGVQPPTIYRLFGDKQGLLDAVAEQGYAAYVGPKLAGGSASDDPVEELRRGWDAHAEFGRANPALYVLMVEPRRGGASPAARAGIAHLHRLVERIAAAGRLVVPVEQAVWAVHAAGVGATLTSLGATDRQPGAARLARDAVIGAITTDAPVVDTPGPAAAALALRARLPEAEGLSDSERALLAEWLDRIATPSG